VPEVQPTVPQDIVQTYSLKLKAGETDDVGMDGSKVTYYSANKKIATVSKKGIVKALRKGSTTIKVREGINVFKYKVKVTTNPKLSKSTVTVKAKKTVTVSISGKASGVNNTYKNTKIAKIVSAKSASKIKIKGLKKGTTTLKVTVNGVALKLKVKVKK
jgi:hypothetical protein